MNLSGDKHRLLFRPTESIKAMQTEMSRSSMKHVADLLGLESLIVYNTRFHSSPETDINFNSYTAALIEGADISCGKQFISLDLMVYIDCKEHLGSKSGQSFEASDHW